MFFIRSSTGARPKAGGDAAGLMALVAFFSVFAGCASPTTGRVRDAHLLQTGTKDARRIASVETAGPFYERVATSDGGVRESYRPLLYTRIEAESGDAVRREVLWPVYDSSRRGDSLTWRFLIWFGYDKDTTQPDSYGRTWLFPLWFSGTTKEGQDYAALFPVYGTIRDMYFDRIHFTLFPIWVEYDRGTHSTWSVLWPIISKTIGEKRNGFRVFPFYGRMERKDLEKTKFVLWPFWTSGEYYNRNPGRSWMLFPIVGRVERESESSWLVIPPFFNVTRGKGKLDYYRKINAPWPFVQIHDGKDWHKRYFWPIYTHRYDDAGDYSARTYLWPFFNFRAAKRAGLSEQTRSALLLYADSDIRRDSDGDGVYETQVEQYSRLWPLYSHRADPVNSYFKFPDLSFSKRTGALERNLLGMFTLYTRGVSEETQRVDHEALWGAFRYGSGEDYSAFRVWPIYDYAEESGEWSWSVLGGLIGRSGDADEARWRWLWFFGGRGDERAEEVDP